MPQYTGEFAKGSHSELHESETRDTVRVPWLTLCAALAIVEKAAIGIGSLEATEMYSEIVSELKKAAQEGE